MNHSLVGAMSWLRQCSQGVSWSPAMIVIAALGLSACATVSPAPVEQTAACRALFAQTDDAVRAADVADGAAARIKGYPYLRSTRLLASFADQLADDAAFDTWVEHLRQEDLAARRAELRNLDVATAESRWQQLDRCGREMVALELDHPKARQILRQRAAVEDDYSLMARGFGLYPFAVPFLNLGIKGYHEEVAEDYATPLAELDSPGPLRHWMPAHVVDAEALPAVPLNEDALGFPQLSGAQWNALMRHYAPQWWIETGGDYDLPGAPQWRAEGEPSLDTDTPVVYAKHDYTRFGDQVLPVLVYTLWFSERPQQKSLDAYAGALDGVIWRVVLDPQLQPLVYDTIHPCGCYRYTFPAQALTRIPSGGFWQESVLFPQEQVPDNPLALRVQSETHYLRRVVDSASVVGETSRYQLLPYDVLRSLPLADGRRRSLFAEDGIVEGTQRGERWWLWITGVPDPGAMRQWGRHATSFVGRSHFDDARFLEQNFEVPDWARGP